MDNHKKRKSKNVDADSRKKRNVSSVGRLNISKVPSASWDPVIASTPGIRLSQSVQLKAYKKINADPGRADELFLQSRNAHITYSGREPANAVKHYVAVYDPAAKSLKLVSARYVPVRGAVVEEEEIEDEARTRLAMRTQLGMAFGTKKSKKSIAGLSQNAISSQSGEKLTKLDEDILEEIVFDPNPELAKKHRQQTADDAKPRPKADRDTHDVSEIYTLDEIVGNTVIMAVPLDDWEASIKQDKRPVGSESFFVIPRLRELKLPRDLEKLRLLRIYKLLLDFLRALVSRGRQLELPQRDALREALGVPDIAINGLVRKFASSGKQLNKWAIDKLQTHIACLALTIDDFNSDFYDLKEDLRLETRELTSYFTELGCKVKQLDKSEVTSRQLPKQSAVLHRRVILTAPVAFPEPRRPLRR